MPVFSGEFRGSYADPGLRSLSGFLAMVVLLALVEPTFAADTSDVKPLRLCADPDNLPYSSDDASKPGFYLEVGQAIGKALGRPVAYNWYKTYFGKRTVRVTLLGGQCDAMIGLPLSDDFMGPAVIFSRKISTQTYALVAKDKAINSVEDLRGSRVAVQYETAPQNVLALRDDIEKVSVLSPEEAMKALDVGTADVAFVWGPAAGWLNKAQYEDRYKIRTVEGEGLSWDAAIGFARTSKGLRDQVDAVLPGLERKIADLATKYGMPNGQPITLHASEDRADPLMAQKAEMSAPRTAPSLAANSANTGSTERSPDAAGSASTDAGKEVFNATCAHCHGVDAVQGERRIDLRRLQLRYGENARATFWTTVHEGRPSKGMPAWKEVLTDDVLNEIYAYLITIQTPASSTN
jgi:polar amino acid transport system substrate-binding protein